jgi:aminomethyltransferase
MDLAALPYYGFREARFAETDCWIARLGYSGEMGYEIVIADAAAPSLWEALLAGGANAGLVECGFDAADSLRIEAGHILFTRELVSSVTPFELGLGRLVDFAGRDFVGAQALRPRRFGAPARRLVGLMSGGESRAPSAVAGEMEPASALPAKLDEGMAVMTSTCFSPLLEQRIGIGFAAAAESAPGSMVDLVGGGRARVARLPFYDPPRALPRRGRRT